MKLKLIDVQKRVDEGTATDEERIFLEREMSVLRYAAEKKLREKKIEAVFNPPPFKKTNPTVKKTADRKAYMENYRTEHKAEILASKKRYDDRNRERIRKNAREYARQKKEAEKIMAKLAEIRNLAGEARVALDHEAAHLLCKTPSYFTIRGTINTFETLLVELLTEKTMNKPDPEPTLRPCMVNGRPGTFHRWAEETDGYFPITVGLVEFEDGKVGMVKPGDVVFDNRTRLYADGQCYAVLEDDK